MTPEFFGITTLLLTYLGGKLLKWLKRRTSKRTEACLEFLASGVEEAWQDMGKEWKSAGSDGKFTSTERRALREYAKSRAMQRAKEQGLDLLKNLATERLDSLIKHEVDRRKAAVGNP